MTGASLALSALAQAHAEGVPLDEFIERDPVVLALVPPHGRPGATDGRVRRDRSAITTTRTTSPTGRHRPRGAAPACAVGPGADGQAAWELGRRMVDVGLLPPSRRRPPAPSRRARRRGPAAACRSIRPAAEPAGRIPSRPASGSTTTVGRGPSHAPAAASAPTAIGAGGGTATAAVHVHARDGDVPPGSVLVVSHLDPRLATVIPRLAGLVAETGSPLSHLAILAREHGVADRRRPRRRHPLAPGPATVVTVDGHGGTVTSGVAA